MNMNRVVGFLAAALMTAAQWSVFFDLHLQADAARILAAAVVADAGRPAAVVQAA